MTFVTTLCERGRAVADAFYRVIHREDDSFSLGITRSGVLAQTKVVWFGSDRFASGL
jgi:hypothetical protein